VTLVEPPGPREGDRGTDCGRIRLIFDVRAVKIGHAGDTAAIDTVADSLGRFVRCPIVLDPVMVRMSGDALLSADAFSCLRRRLLPNGDTLPHSQHPNCPKRRFC